jgi:translation initiation factor 1
MSSPKKNEKIVLNGGEILGQNPFAALSGLNFPNAPLPAQATTTASGKPATPAPQKNRGRVDVLREKAGRGGRTVTVAAGFTGIGLPEKEQLAKKMQKACGVGGTVKDGRIEIQGDKRDEVARILTEAGFRPVFSGG